MDSIITYLVLYNQYLLKQINILGRCYEAIPPSIYILAQTNNLLT